MGLIKQSRISHRKVSRIEQCFCLDIDATRTAVLASVNRKTANRFFSYFRLAIYWHQVNELRKVMGPVVGEAECDEAYFGAKRVRGFHGKSKRGRGTSKQPVFGIFERGGRVFTELVPDCKKKTLQALILGRVSKEAVVYTDSWRGYDGLVDIGYDRHVRINHRRDEFSRGNGVPSTASSPSGVLPSGGLPSSTGSRGTSPCTSRNASGAGSGRPTS